MLYFDPVPVFSHNYSDSIINILHDRSHLWLRFTANDLQIWEQCLELCSTLKITKKNLGKTHIFQELLYSYPILYYFISEKSEIIVKLAGIFSQTHNSTLLQKSRTRFQILGIDFYFGDRCYKNCYESINQSQRHNNRILNGIYTFPIYFWYAGVRMEVSWFGICRYLLQVVGSLYIPTLV